MPIDDPEQALGFERCRDTSRQAELIGDAMQSVGEENVIDRLRHERIDGHGIRPDKLAIVGAGLCDARPRITGSMSIAYMCFAIRASGTVNSPSPQQRSIAAMPGSTPISTRIFSGSGHSACHQSASGIVVAGKKPTIIPFSRARSGIRVYHVIHGASFNHSSE
jgi:hypothetical protein